MTSLFKKSTQTHEAVSLVEAFKTESIRRQQEAALKMQSSFAALRGVNTPAVTLFQPAKKTHQHTQATTHRIGRR